MAFCLISINMENNGWIKVHRKLLNNPISRKPYYAWVWIYLLLICNHDKQEFIWNGGRKTVKRGQVITGRINISQNTGVPQSTVERILNYLEKDGQIEQQKTNKYRLITVKNYNLYQDQWTTNGQQMDNKRTQTRMNKNEKNEKNILQTEVCEVIPDLLKDKRKNIQIIGLYAKAKKTTFENVAQQTSFIKRNLRAAQNLAGYDIQRIMETMYYLLKRADFKWTLETVGKYIDEDLNNIKNKGQVYDLSNL
jgi:hypothetical protein